MSMMKRIAVKRGYVGVAAVCGALSACINAQPSKPLPTGEVEVGYLYGYVRDVDGVEPQSTAHGFELTPGCHVVGTPSSFGGVGPGSALVGRTGNVLFLLYVRPGYRYEVEVVTVAPNELSTRGGLIAREKDATGVTTRMFYPLRAAKCPGGRVFESRDLRAHK